MSKPSGPGWYWYMDAWGEWTAVEVEWSKEDKALYAKLPMERWGHLVSGLAGQWGGKVEPPAR